MRTRLWLVAAMAATGAARADELKLKDGRTFEGKLTARDAERTTFRTCGGELTFKSADVASVEIKPTRAEEYAARARELAPADVEGRFALACWCEAQGLYAERRAELRRVVEASPDHAEARAALGQVKVGERWLDREAALRAKGWVKRGDRWLSPEEDARLERLRKEKERRAALVGELRRLLGRLYDAPEAKAAVALADLERFARSRKLTALVELLPEIEADARAWRIAAVEARLQWSTTSALAPRTLNLGTGTPVTLELPRTTTTTVRTTVGVPVR
ncbi:MAG TPA: hypothetical protein VEI02_05305 [Planctomycetota bacterium]|nr:hypothetical protein [Planctomycetota bacterium]